MPNHPSYKSNREYESELTAIRVDKYLTVKELCKAAGVSETLFVALNNGMVSPIYISKKGAGIKKSTSRILQVLDCSFEDAFPRYVCKLIRDEYLVDDQIAELTMAHESSRETPMEALLRKELWQEFQDILSRLWPRATEVMNLRFYEGNTLEDVGSIMGMTRERVRQIEAKSLRILRRSLRKKYDSLCTF